MTTTQTSQREAIAECVAGARDRLQSAHRDLNDGEMQDAIFCLMRAINHIAVAVDVLSDPELA